MKWFKTRIVFVLLFAPLISIAFNECVPNVVLDLVGRCVSGFLIGYLIAYLAFCDVRDSTI